MCREEPIINVGNQEQFSFNQLAYAQWQNQQIETRIQEEYGIYLLSWRNSSEIGFTGESPDAMI